ncbi:hydroxyisourate hydrolase [Oceanisphaera sp.]|uniref:hydroxyisourate hydrolase n=1 Tax=Oceanisphaera sp. TaxID=1929979 RepID=UPI003A94CFAE
MGKLTTHILDAAKGLPGSDIKIELFRVEGERTRLINTLYSNGDGRTDAPVLEGEDYVPGKYQLVFHIGPYLKRQGIELLEPAFLDDVVIRFGLAAGQEHYHVPLLFSPYSYSTYRGS